MCEHEQYIVFVGTMPPELDVIDGLHRRGYNLSLMQRLHSTSSAGGSAALRPNLVVLTIERDTPVARLGHMLHQQGCMWMAVNRSDDPALTLLAYAAGACTVLPAQATAPIVLQTIDTLLAAQPSTAVTRWARIEQLQYYRRGERIALEPETVLDVRQGVIAQMMIDQDGTEVLLGLYGTSHLLLGHPPDPCCIELVAHTDAAVVLRSWDEVVADPLLPERLRMRVQLMEAWTAMQARPYLDQRLSGLLALLAEQFGVPQDDGVLVDVRLTHTQLAAAIGATRSTVTRLLGDLRARGVITSIGAGDKERFCLRQWEPGHHGATRQQGNGPAEPRMMAACTAITHGGAPRRTAK